MLYLIWNICVVGFGDVDCMLLLYVMWNIVVVDDVVKVDVAEIVVAFVASDTVVVVDVLFVFVESSVKKKISIYLTQDRTRSRIIAFKPKALKIIYRHIFLLPLTHHILAL